MAPLCIQCDAEIVFDDKGLPTNAVCKNATRVSQKGAPPKFSCYDCNRLCARIYFFQAKDASLKGCFCGMTGEEKKVWYRSHADFVGLDLGGALTSLVKINMQEEEQEGFHTAGEWLDEEDLIKKYKDKPDQLAAIKAKARTLKHPTRDVTLFEDLTFTANASVGQKRTVDKTAQFETQEKIKRTKQEKPEPGPKREKTDQKELTVNGKVRMEKLKEKASKELENLQAKITEAAEEKFKGLIAERIAQDAAKLKLEMGAAIASLDIVLGDGWVGKAHEIESECRGKIASCKTSTMRLTKQLDDAQEMLDQ